MITRIIDLGTPEIDEISEKNQTKRADNMKCVRDPPGHLQTGIQWQDFATFSLFKYLPFLWACEIDLLMVSLGFAPTPLV